MTASVDAAPDPSRRRLYVRGEIDRRDFGLRWSRAIETSGVVAATVRLELDLEFERVRTERPHGAAGRGGGMSSN